MTSLASYSDFTNCLYKKAVHVKWVSVSRKRSIWNMTPRYSLLGSRRFDTATSPRTPGGYYPTTRRPAHKNGNLSYSNSKTRDSLFRRTDAVGCESAVSKQNAAFTRKRHSPHRDFQESTAGSVQTACTTELTQTAWRSLLFTFAISRGPHILVFTDLMAIHYFLLLRNPGYYGLQNNNVQNNAHCP